MDRVFAYGLRRLTSLYLFLAAGCLTCCGKLPAQTDTAIPRSETRPNIILINLDDADTGSFSSEILQKYLPTFEHLSKQGIRLNNCHVTTPLCGPSRASLLLGQYAHRTGIRTNRAAGPLNNGFSGGFQLFCERGFESEHLGSWMQRAGYRTMMVGKYAHGPVNPVQLKGWDDLHVSFGGNYFGANVYSTRVSRSKGRFDSDRSAYRTNQEAAAIVWMLQQQGKQTKQESSPRPFFLYFAPFAPHKPAGTGKMLPQNLAKVGHEIRLPDSPDLNEVDISDKPKHLRVRLISDKMMETIEEEHRRRVVSLISVDRLLKQMLDTLETASLIDNTFIFLTSDHGYQLGHNRMVAKKLPFDRNTRVPLWVIGPGIQPDSTADQLVAQIDLAPTFLELAGASAPIDFDGRLNRSDFPESLRSRGTGLSPIVVNRELGNQGTIRQHHSCNLLVNAVGRDHLHRMVQRQSGVL